MRPDGTRVKEASTIVSALPYVMPRRYDAQNFITEYADMEILRRYIQEKRREGVRIPYMTLILAAYFKAYQENPKINRFIMNSKIYQRNHFCVSFVILKTRADGRADETSIKVFFEDGDDIFSINRKIEEAVAQNQVAAHNNNTDKFANFLFAIPILPGFLFGLVKLMDRCGLLPRKIIDLSPFHTSLFITNLASINTNSIFHHCYEFGTTGVFVCMGKPIANYMSASARDTSTRCSGRACAAISSTPSCWRGSRRRKTQISRRNAFDQQPQAAKRGICALRRFLFYM